MKFLSLEGLIEYTTVLLNKVRSMLSAYIPLSGSESITGTIRSTHEIQSTAPNAFRLANPEYGTILRNDGTNTHVLLTNQKDPYGSWNNLRPLSIENASGKVRFENGLSGNLSGNASSSSKSNALASTGFGDTNLTFCQTAEEFDGNSNWCNYIIANHGSGENYYHYTIGLPFWDSPIYQRQTGNTESKSGWHKFHTTETITSGTNEMTSGSTELKSGHIYLQYE